jgi:hypothetical protein
MHNCYLIWVKGDYLTTSFANRGHCFKDPDNISVPTGGIVKTQSQSAAD